MANIGIICDTTTTLDQKFLEKHNIHLLHNSICDSEGNVIVDDCSDEQKLMVCQEIKNESKVYKTSLVNVQQVLELSKKLLKKYDLVVYLTLNTLYSGQFEQTTEAAKELGGKLIVINSQSIATHSEVVLNWLVQYIHNLKKVDEFKIDFVNETIKEIYKHTTIMYSTPNYEGLVTSGRMPKALGLTLKLTKMFPIIIAEETNKRGGFYRKWSESENNIFKAVDERFNKPPRGKDIKEMFIVQSLCSNERIEELKDRISKYFEIDKEMIKVRVTPLVVIIATLVDSWGVSLYTSDEIVKTN